LFVHFSPWISLGFCCCCCCFLIVGFLLLFLFLLFFFFFWFLYYQLYHHLPLISTLTSFTLPHSLVIKPIAPLYNSFCHFLPPVFPQLPPSSPILPQHDTTLPLPPSYSWPTEQPTIPTLHNPKPLQSVTQTPSSTTTEIDPNIQKDHKNNSPHNAFLTHQPHFLYPLLVPSYPTHQISIAKITNINPPSHTVYRYYQQRVSCITHKLLVRD
jgi:hypothetical protein